MPLETILFYGFIGSVILLSLWIIRLEIKLRRLTRGKTGKSLEDSIYSVLRRQETFEDREKELEEYLKTVEARLRRSIQNVETIRFNPFEGVGQGGNQSFATAFLSEEGNGVVLSSIYARDRMSVFSKPVRNHSSEYELSNEEKQVIASTKNAPR